MTWNGTAIQTPAINVYKNSAQTISSSTTTLVVMNVIRSVSGDMALQAGGQVQVPRDGWYQINACVSFSASTASNRRIVFIGAGNSPGTFSYYASSILASAQDTSNITALSTSTVLYLSAGQQFGVSANVTGTAWALEVSQTYMTHLSGVWLGP